ncbi:MAG: DUF4838 domain-containing protein [Clostridia bacterium]|nr:DUF4838 domain-containing protein [Clostridia bacterium]
MKKIVSVIVMFSVLICCLPWSAFAAETAPAPLTEDAVIVTAPDANAYESAAATRLQERLSGLFGLELPVVTADEVENRFGVYIGSAAGIDVAGRPDGSYILRSLENGVALAGAGTRGNSNAVYAFLEKYGGCKVYTRERGMTSEQAGVLLPEKIDVAYTPFFEYTDTDWHSPRDTEYSLMNGLNGGIYRSIPGAFGGTVNYITFAHSLATTFCSANTYFESHPEYFALHEGERTGDQLCLTNEDVYRIVESEVLNMLSWAHDPNAALQILSLTQNDNRHYCECDACRALDEANGSHAGTMLTFVNRIARAVAAAGYDNVVIDTFAYQYTRKAPTQVKPEPNVCVRLCSIECCFSHPLDDPDCPENAAFMQDLKDWSELSDRLYIWDYTTNYSKTTGPFPDFGVLQRNMQIFYENHARGIYEEGNYYVDACNTEFGELRAYLISKLLQDPYCDYDAEMNGFLKAYYGDGWQSIRDYIDLTNKAAARTHVGIYEQMLETFVFLPGETCKADQYWETAKSASSGEELEHVLRSELSWRFWKASAGVGEFANLCKAVDARKQLVADFKEYGVTMMNEGTQHELNEWYMYVPTRYWYDTIDSMTTWEKLKFIISRNVDLLHRYRLFFEKLAKARLKIG